MRSKRKPVLKAEPTGDSAVIAVADEKVPPIKRVSWGRKILKVLGPGLVTRAADDDPSGIATYPSVGVIAVPVMVFMMLMASRRKIVGKLNLPFYLKALGRVAAVIMALARSECF
jgi:Mn2+/Fe2+ NRAMP family transporter